MVNELGDEHRIWKLEIREPLCLHHVVTDGVCPVHRHTILNAIHHLKVSFIQGCMIISLSMMILVTTIVSNLSSIRRLPTWKYLVCPPWFRTHWLQYCTLLNSFTALVSPLRTCTPLCLRPATSFHVCLVISIFTPLTLVLRMPLLNLRLA